MVRCQWCDTGDFPDIRTHEPVCSLNPSSGHYECYECEGGGWDHSGTRECAECGGTGCVPEAP